jgi:MoaA/NifB/PqqE/SkfB family radical SAM enzyme
VEPRLIAPVEVAMTGKFWRRTLRNIVFRRHPYFAHLSLTHRCNLRCSFCQIPLERTAELDLAGMKRVIDVLDRLGIAVVSMTGGEPLLRPDCPEIVDYAASKGLFVKVSSNGTMPRDRYARLLASRVSEIGISLDGVRGEALPYRHDGGVIRSTLRFLNDHLPAGKRLVINVTVSPDNRDDAQEIVDYCTKEYPRARIWLNPVVVGQGKLRVDSMPKVNPGFLDTVTSPTLLKPAFYARACREYYARDTFAWGCRAGEVFMDIKPNGDLWLCQDYAAEPKLNVLQPHFASAYRHADFSNRKTCSGCTYCCYYVVQNAFKPGNWVDMAACWWTMATEPGDACRTAAAQSGWAAGLAAFLLARPRRPIGERLAE